jgi:hypothetical protein
VLVHRLAHDGQVGGVAVVPEPGGDERRLVRLGADGAVLRVDGGPASLGLQRSMTGLAARLANAEAGAVRNLVEAVPKRLRADPDRLEEDIMTGVAGDARTLTGLRLLLNQGPLTSPPRAGLFQDLPG